MIEKVKDIWDDWFGTFGYITRPLRDTKYWVYHRTIDKYHTIDTGLKPGYYDVDTRMLHGVMALVVSYVEEERDGDIKLAAWAKELIDGPHGEWTKEMEIMQGEKELKVLEIYKWWKYEYVADCLMKDAMLHELYKDWTFEDRKTRKRDSGWLDAEKKMRELEEKIAADEQKYLHMAIDERTGMWS